MLKGIDVSNWQGSMNFGGNDFVIMKASEGINFKDKMMDKHLSNVQKAGIECYGFYHYARPDTGNSPEDEAIYFVSLIKAHIGKAIFVLDWEQESLNYSTEWALRWLRKVHELTGVKPLIYIQASQEWSGNYQNIINEDFGLWVAHWGVDNPRIENWGIWALWQFTDTPYDTNYFNGDRQAWFRYCGQALNNPICTDIKKGDMVQVLTEVDYNGVTNDDWVLGANFTVMYEPKGNRVVIGRNGVLVGAWNKEDLRKI